jgi:hypothetical protein
MMLTHDGFTWTRFLIPFAIDSAGGTAMGRAYSQDLRERVIGGTEFGSGCLCRGIPSSVLACPISTMFLVGGRGRADERASLGGRP